MRPDNVFNFWVLCFEYTGAVATNDQDFVGSRKSSPS